MSRRTRASQRPLQRRKSDRVTSLLREWLQDHRGHEDSQEFALELRYYRTFLRATLTACIRSDGTPYLWSRLRIQYDPHPARHYRPRSNTSPSNVSSSVVSAPPTPSDSVSLSTAGSSQRTTSSARGARTKPPRALRQTSAEERRRLFFYCAPTMILDQLTSPYGRFLTLPP